MNDDLQAKLAALLQQGQPPPSTGWATPASVLPTITGVAVPISVSTPVGKIRCYLQLPPDVGADPNRLLQALEQLNRAGYPLDVWQGKSGWGAQPSANRGGWSR